MEHFKNKAIKFVADYTLLCLGVVVIFFTIRLFEYVYVDSKLSANLNSSLFFGKSVKYDTLFVLYLWSIGLVPMLLISLIHQLTYRITIRTTIFILILLQLTFTQFFLTNNSILTAVLLEFTLAELAQIASHEVSGNRTYFWVMNFTIIASSLWFLISKFRRYKANLKATKIISVLGIILCMVGFLSRNDLSKQIQAFDSEYEYMIGNSKPVFFMDSYLRTYQQTEIDGLTKKLAIINYQKSFPNRNFTSETFPLIYESADENVIGPYFIKDSIAPNIVIVISESLSGTFSGTTNCIGGSITPFTDSLAKEGLNWTHFLANADRSFGALSNILASLPYGTTERGFTGSYYADKFGTRYPNQISIIQYLKEAGYFSKYYFGGWKQFDKIEYFMRYNGIDEFTADHNFDTSKYKMKAKHQGENVWGYNDRDLFSQSIDDLFADKTNKPFISIYQTLTNHSPYNIAPEKYFDKAYLTERLKKMGQQLESIPIPKNIVSCVVAADDDLRFFIEAFKKDKRFNQTIFVIVGDHAVNLNLRSHALERFHVPLIIYSPLIKQTASFAGMCSHIDIAPTLLALLEGNFGQSFSKQKHFMGKGLDTSTAFNAQRHIPLTINRMDIPSFIVDNMLEYGGQLYSLDQNWKHVTAHAEDINKAKEWIEMYKVLNRVVCDENRIWNQTSGTLHNHYLDEAEMVE